MPRYDYRCKKCGEFEVQQSIKDEPLKACPKCSESVEKLISKCCFELKGSGFYSTDYKKK